VFDLGVAGAQCVDAVRMVGFQLVQGHGLVAREVEERILEQTGMSYVSSAPTLL
jgi:hypothetical protein